MNRLASVAFTGVFGILTAASAEAQQQGAGQQGVPNQQGQKGPVGQTNAGQQGAYDGGIGQTPWFNNPEIRQQFKMNEQQYNQFNKSYSENYGRYQKDLNSLGKDMTDAQRMQKMNELQQRFNKDLATTADRTFTDPQQRQRYNQLYMQYQGFNAFSDPMVQEKLNLTSTQREKLSQYNQEWHKQMNDLSRASQTDRDGSMKQFNTMRNQAGERINTLLTPEQQKAWQQMVGEPYNFQPNVYFQSGTGATINRAPGATQPK